MELFKEQKPSGPTFKAGMVSRSIKVSEHEVFKHVYEAMKKSREEINDAVENQRLIFFDTVPMSFDESDPCENPDYKFGAEKWQCIYK